MRYSYEFKRKCVELYRDGKWPATPEGVKQRRFRYEIREWVRIEEANGPEALKHQSRNKSWTPESRYELVAQVLAGKSISGVAMEAGINSGLLYQWVRKYKAKGYNGLVDIKKAEAQRIRK